MRSRVILESGITQRAIHLSICPAKLGGETGEALLLPHTVFCETFHFSADRVQRSPINSSLSLSLHPSCSLGSIANVLFFQLGINKVHLSFYLSFPHGLDVLQHIVESIQLLGGVGRGGVLRYEDKLLDGFRRHRAEEQ